MVLLFKQEDMIKVDAESVKLAPKVGYSRKDAKAEAVRRDSAGQRERNRELLGRVAECYSAMYDLRRRRMRSRRFYRGDQWSDYVEVNGERIREEDYIRQQGKPALKQNMIRPPLRNVVGQYRSSPFKPVVFARNRQNQKAAEMMSVALEAALFMNEGKERDVRALEEFLLSGMVVYKTGFSFDYERQQPIPKFRAVNPNRFFINTNLEDVCGDDVDFIGELADLSFDDVVAEYACGGLTADDLRRMYGDVDRFYASMPGFDAKRMEGIDPLVPQDGSRCRVIEVWRLEAEWRLWVHDYLDGSYEVMDGEQLDAVTAENAAREAMGKENGVEVPPVEYERKYVKFWKCYHLTPCGETLWEGETPYEHCSHPYVFKLYPMLDGEVWGMVEDLIDQQKMVNRMVILQDFIISASAKGVLLVPEDCIPDDMTIEDFAEEWVKYNGVIRIKLKPGQAAPQQVAANSLHVGITEMIQMQLRLMQDIAGVQGAIQGKAPNSGTAASLYAQEAQNASLNVLDYLETFSAFLQRRDKKLLQVIKQFYTERQYIAVAGSDYSEEARNYDPETIRNVDFDNSIARGTDAPSYRVVVDDILWKLLEGRFISAEMFLEHCSYPFADKVLQAMKKMREDLSRGQMPEGVPAQLLAQVEQEAGQMTPEQQEQAAKLMNGGFRKGIDRKM